MRTGVLGGTFDPPHLAHLTLGAAAKHALELDRVIFVPAGSPWRKADRAVTPASTRVAMLHAALEPLPWAEVSLIEVEREGPSYATETLPLLANNHGGDWWFILGDDALADMPNWHEPDGLLESARLGLAWRPPGKPSIPDEVQARFPGIEARIDIVPMPQLYISSTDLRRRIREGLPVDVLLPESVRAFIDEHQLYREPE